MSKFSLMIEADSAAEMAEELKELVARMNPKHVVDAVLLTSVFDMSVRMCNIFRRLDIITLEDLLDTPVERVTSATNFGRFSWVDLVTHFREINKGLGMSYRTGRRESRSFKDVLT